MHKHGVWSVLGGLVLLASLLAPLPSAGAQAGPAAPTDVMAEPGNGQVTLSWTAGADNGSTVLRWEYTQSTPATGLWIPIPGSGRATTRHTVTGLNNGGPDNNGQSGYRFRVRAVSRAGNGAQSGESVVSATVTEAIPTTAPGAPANLRADVDNSRAVLSWTAAVANTAADGFSPIRSYQYRQKTGPGDYGPWNLIVASGAATASHPITGLTNGTSYQFQVRAVNANGAGDLAESESVTVATTPGRPRSLDAAPGNRSVVLSWTPSTDGGSPITGWQFRLKEGQNQADPGDFVDADAWIAIPDSGPDTTTYTVAGLDNTSRYKFQVRAVNARGDGTAAESAVADPGMAPGAPTGLSGAASHNSITITWTPPLDEAGTGVNNGGAPILRYEYSLSADGGDYGEWKAIPALALFEAPLPAPPTPPVAVSDINARTTVVAHMVSGLTAGTAYRFRVRAVNAISPSAYVGFQGDHPLYVGTRPPSPAAFSARPIYNVATGVARVVLSWTSGGDGDSPITRWQYRTNTTLAGLADDSLSPWEDICNSLPTYTGPAPPCGASATSLTLPRAPLTPGGTDGPDGTLAFTPGNEYFFVIRAVNDQGDGFQSATGSATFPVNVPTAPEAVYIGGTTGTVSSANITLNWRESLSGGSPILRYQYSVRTGTGSWGGWISADTTTTLSYPVPTTTPAGTVHQFRIRAENAEGVGAATVSPPIVAGAPGVPGAANLATENAPNLSAAPGNTQISLAMIGTTGNTDADTRWEYSYRVGSGGYSGWSFSNSGAEFDPSSINPIDGLANGVAHTFRIRAVNAGQLAGPELVSDPVSPGVAPPAPLGLSAAAGDQEVILSWTSQGSGGSPITIWQVCGGVTPAPGTQLGCNTDDDWVVIRNSRANTNTHTIKTLLGTQTPLANGTSYTFQVRARNRIGGGAPAQTNPTTPGQSPGAPSRTLVEASDGRATITVDPPSEDNGSPVVGYEVRKRQGDGPYDAWEALGTTARPPATPSAQSGAVVTGLVNGTTYTFQVRAVNGFGPGAAITSAPITPIGAPTVAMLDADPGNAQAVLTWALVTNGGRAITAWQYRQSASGGGYGAWTDIAGDPDTTSHTVSGLANGVSYTFQVRAVNGFGPSAEVTSASVNPAAVPPQPSVTAVRGNGQVDLSWTAGASGAPGEADYAAPTTGWQYRMATDDGDFGAWSDIAGGADTTSLNVTGLTNGTAYAFEVRAENAMGHGEAGRAGPVTPATIPSAPVVTAVRGDTSTTVSWTAGDDGGSAVVAWHLQVNGGEWVAIDVDPLANSYDVPTDDVTDYTFAVRAVNDVGEGDAGTASVEAGTVPDAPTVTAIGSPGSITVSWVAGDDGGSAITGWYYRTKVGIAGYGDWTEVSADTVTVTLSGLDTGTGALIYTFQVGAVNSAGAGPVATSNDVTPLAAPPANGVFYSGVIDGPDFCTDFSLGGAHLIAHDGDGDGVADVCSLPYTRREAIARQSAVEALSLQYAAEYAALVNAACAATEGDADCGGDMPAAPPAVPINDGGPYYSGIITGPSFCANRSLGGPTTYPHDDDRDGVADVCALPYTRREAIARQLAGDILAATYPADFRRELTSACRGLTGADYGDDPAHLEADACA